MEKLLVINVEQSLRQVRKRLEDIKGLSSTEMESKIDGIVEALDYIIEVV